MSEAAEQGAVTAGALLREARQSAGVHIAALAVALKVPVSKLEALEADNYDALPDTVFVRALASSMCRTLKMDPAPVLSLLPQSQTPRLSTDGGGLNTPMKSAGGKSSASSSSSLTTRSAPRPVSWVVLALLVGALVMVLVPRHTEDVAGSGAVVAPGVASNVTEPAVSAVTPSASEVGAASGAAGTLTPQSSTEPPSPAIAPAAAAAASAGMDAASAAPAASSAVLVLRARSESWVQVRDASGALALQRNLAAGETVSISAPPPLAVVVGRADVTEVVVRGKVFDLAAISRENVARFEVK